jgi:hypothetical protein
VGGLWIANRDVAGRLAPFRLITRWTRVLMYAGLGLLVAPSVWNSWPQRAAKASFCFACVPAEAGFIQGNAQGAPLHEAQNRSVHREIKGKGHSMLAAARQRPDAEEHDCRLERTAETRHLMPAACSRHKVRLLHRLLHGAQVAEQQEPAAPQTTAPRPIHGRQASQTSSTGNDPFN